MICIQKNIRIKIKLFLGSKKNILSGCFFFLNHYSGKGKEGKKEASNQATKKRSKEGRQQGSKQARKQGRKETRKEGGREGRKEGRKEGMKLKAVFQDTYTLVERGSLTIST
jgi:flagellar biosynthesis/type III secretory pathway protein FliH